MGQRESGAFLLARRERDIHTISRVVYLDDLDPNCLQGGIHLDGSAYGPLWNLCDQENMRVVADVHTHPGDWVGQSSIDADNPMVARVGHIALIVPDLASRSIIPAEVGVHIYQGDSGWNSHIGRQAAHLLYVGRWA
jgi:hypothetical protein